MSNINENLGIDLEKKSANNVLGFIGQLDGVMRDVFYKRLEDYPVALMISITEQDLKDALPDTRRNLSLLAVVFSVIAAFVSWLMLRMIDQHKRLESAEASGRESGCQLQISEARLQSIFDASPDALLISDEQGRITMANQQVEYLSGYGVSELIGQPVEILVPEFARQCHAGLRASYIRESTARPMGGGRGIRVLKKDSSECEIEASLSRIKTDQGVYVATSLRDITERKRSESELRIAAAAFESQECMVVTDANGIILRINQTFTETTGYTESEAIGQTPRLLKSGRHSAEFYSEMWEILINTGRWQGEVWDRRKNGEEYPSWLTISAVKDANGVTTNYVGTHADITLRKQAEEKINELAFYDQLTSLPNRTLFLDRVKQAMKASERTGNSGALLFIDLDNFKTLNDTMGHDMGDLLLKQVAQRLLSCIRAGDTVARLGGDEFMVMLTNLSPLDNEAATNIEIIGEKIISTLNQKYQLNDVAFRSTPSIGATLFKGQQASVDDLMKQADLAMYKSKDDAAMESVVKKRADMEHDLRNALSEKQFSLHYQPLVLDDGYTTGAEALLRWLHPERGSVSPAEFIPMAEETGVILPLGKWVLETACSQLATWASQPELSHLTIAVNVSVQQFRQPDFVEQVLSVLKSTGANPKRLKLELTESLLVKNVDDIVEKMGALKAQGVGFSLDDFGTGYSSLSYLKRLPLDQLKIDQSFVRDVLTDFNDASIAKTIIALAHGLGLGVIAEGVETGGQRDFLENAGCRAYQGYFFSRPKPLTEFELFVREK
jgi:diguanylate cyclase (GGDEF)-like protein/PAS domain S-box-containing protein